MVSLHGPRSLVRARLRPFHRCTAASLPQDPAPRAGKPPGRRAGPLRRPHVYRTDAGACVPGLLVDEPVCRPSRFLAMARTGLPDRTGGDDIDRSSDRGRRAGSHVRRLSLVSGNQSRMASLRTAPVRAADPRDGAIATGRLHRGAASRATVRAGSRVLHRSVAHRGLVLVGCPAHCRLPQGMASRFADGGLPPSTSSSNSYPLALPALHLW